MHERVRSRARNEESKRSPAAVIDVEPIVVVVGGMSGRRPLSPCHSIPPVVPGRSAAREAGLARGVTPVRPVPMCIPRSLFQFQGFCNPQPPARASPSPLFMVPVPRLVRQVVVWECREGQVKEGSIFFSFSASIPSIASVSVSVTIGGIQRRPIASSVRVRRSTKAILRWSLRRLGEVVGSAKALQSCAEDLLTLECQPNSSDLQAGRSTDRPSESQRRMPPTLIGMATCLPMDHLPTRSSLHLLLSNPVNPVNGQGKTARRQHFCLP